MHFAPLPHELVTRTPALDDAHQSVDTLGKLLRRGRFVLTGSVLSNLSATQRHTLCMRFAPPPHELVTRTPALDDAHQSVDTHGKLLRWGWFVLAGSVLSNLFAAQRHTLCMQFAPPPQDAYASFADPDGMALILNATAGAGEGLDVAGIDGVIIYRIVADIPTKSQWDGRVGSHHPLSTNGCDVSRKGGADFDGSACFRRAGMQAQGQARADKLGGVAPAELYYNAAPVPSWYCATSRNWRAMNAYTKL
ncbi:hypothetical protein B0H14DRAFT_2655755 [Mycena olivaceomarginata]|nr:hypothetical protein B0H14DRAFT_2655755 [Mycena olivaceomarginata]